MNPQIVLETDNTYQKLNRLPEDPIDAEIYGFATSEAQAMITIHNIDQETAMPFAYPDEVINGIHQTLASNQALIEVVNGVTQFGESYIYSIIKTKMEPHGVQYFCLLQMTQLNSHLITNVKAFYTEVGITGKRDATVYSYLRNEGIIGGKNGREWQFDPYDSTYLADFLMNLSELPDFDSVFPHHPLSVLRQFIKEVTK